MVALHAEAWIEMNTSGYVSTKYGVALHGERGLKWRYKEIPTNRFESLSAESVD